MVTRPGPTKGSRLLPVEVEQRIEQAIDTIFKTRERPRATGQPCGADPT